MNPPVSNSQTAGQISLICALQPAIAQEPRIVQNRGTARGYHELRTSSAAQPSSATDRRIVGQAAFLYIATYAENALFCR
jgi:hypothetical protein